MKLLILTTLSISATWCAGPILTPPQVQAAILQGGLYKTADQYLEKGLYGRRVRLAGFMARDGITKYATFFNDWGSVCAAAAAANQQMRKLAPEDIRIMGLLHAFVEVHARGASGAGKLDRRYGRDRTHLVLQLADGRIIQPIDKSMLYRSGQSLPAYLMGLRTGKITLDFAFDVLPQDLSQPVVVILIDGEGNRQQAKLDLGGILDFSGER